MPDTDPQISREALRWVARRHSGDWSAEDSAQLDRWVNAHAEHAEAWRRAQQEWNQWGELRAIAAPEIAVALERQPVRRWRVAASLVAALVCATAAYVLHRFPGALSRESFHVTQLGGHRTLGLPDGSTVELNTSSQLAVDFGITCRCLRLLSGEAVFHAAHGDPRPFKVQAGATTTRDIGTEFWIRVRPEETNIAVLEGSVETSSPAFKVPQQLRADNRLTLDAGGHEMTAGDVPLQDLMAWRRGEIVFRDAPLGDVLAEFARYHELQFRFDARLNAYHLSGRFASADLDGLLGLIESSFPVRIEREQGNSVLTLRSR
ncbi:MAG: FecR domain-containing protein [Proteobacteria bacterium]|nr:FecR domain-containing protein [Pseudomonadota bacterium]